MRAFWVRLARLNAPFLAGALREAARQIELLEPGSPVAAYPPLFYDSKEVPHMGSITVKDSDQPFRASVSFVDEKGSPTTADDVPQWASADESVVTAVADADGYNATLTPGSPGTANAATAQITVSSTRASDGVVIESVGAVTVTAGEAAVGDVEFQAPPSPEPPPGP